MWKIVKKHTLFGRFQRKSVNWRSKWKRHYFSQLAQAKPSSTKQTFIPFILGHNGAKLPMKSHLNSSQKFNFQWHILKLKHFGILLSIDDVVSLKSLLVETTMPINNKTPNSLSLCLAYQILKAQNIFVDMWLQKKSGPILLGPPSSAMPLCLHLPSIYQPVWASPIQS